MILDKRTSPATRGEQSSSSVETELRGDTSGCESSGCDGGDDGGGGGGVACLNTHRRVSLATDSRAKGREPSFFMH